MVVIEVTIEFDRQRYSDEKLVATKNWQAQQERHPGCLQNLAYEIRAKCKRLASEGLTQAEACDDLLSVSGISESLSDR